ncbi:MAG: fluoride efflux transporter CrcB [Bacteroidetes bacterium]|nr:fluoride efflux transporter CrcB [Bacteroidota bacterium]
MTWLAVAFGGAIGSMLRYGVSLAALQGYLGNPNAAFPLGTFLINVLGSFLMGLLWGWQSAQPDAWSPVQRGAVFSGLLGGFTTFSAFSLEGLQLFRAGHQNMALAYLGGSVLLGTAAAALGFWLGQRWAAG